MTDAADGALEREFESLLQFLQQSRGFDFTAYKRPSLMRRVIRRIQMLNLSGFDGYRDYLETHQDEFRQLFNAILINVTSFFRDPQAWEFVAAEVVPEILRRKPSGEQIRVWSAGCASGEEAYSVAIMFAEAMGDEAFKQRVKVYASDVDEEALAQARAASYAAKDVEGLSDERRERYFEHANDRHVFRSDLRRSVIFGRNDLVQDAPISRLDLLLCRNTLMYFNAEAQASIVGRFHFALNGHGQGNGYLFLGRAEMLTGHSHLFAPLDLKCRVFARVPPHAARRAAPAENGNGADMNANQRLREQALEESVVPRIVIDSNGMLAHVNARARTLFSISAKDVGRALQDLEISYRPLELRSLIEQAYAERRTVMATSVERRFPTGQTQYFDVAVAPLYDEGQKPLGAAVTFLDVTRISQLQEELRRSRDEIQTTNEELQSSNEELETTNEGLQSSNEELETTNEELQSTNEELETMNEELQSTNEELQTVNEELRTRGEELNTLNAFLESVLNGLSAGAAVVNQDMNVLMWNKSAQDLWGLRADEVQGKPLFNLGTGLPVDGVRSMMRACMAGEPTKESVIEAVNRRGKKIRLRVSCSALVSAKRREGVILIMEEVP